MRATRYAPGASWCDVGLDRAGHAVPRPAAPPRSRDRRGRVRAARPARTARSPGEGGAGARVGRCPTAHDVPAGLTRPCRRRQSAASASRRSATSRSTGSTGRRIAHGGWGRADGRRPPRRTARSAGRWDDFDPLRDVGLPGEPPFTRGHPPDRLPHRACGRCACSRASARPRTRTRGSSQLLAAGQTGLSIAYDMPTLYGYDTDDPEAEGEFGTCGVAVSIAGRHGGPARRAAAGPHLDLDDDQLAGRADLGDVHRGGREAGRARGPRSRARPRTTSSRSSSPRRNSCSRPSRRCAS